MSCCSPLDGLPQKLPGFNCFFKTSMRKENKSSEMMHSQSHTEYFNSLMYALLPTERKLPRAEKPRTLLKSSHRSSCHYNAVHRQEVHPKNVSFPQSSWTHTQVTALLLPLVHCLLSTTVTQPRPQLERNTGARLSLLREKLSQDHHCSAEGYG